MTEEAVTIKDGNSLCYDCYLERFDDLSLESKIIEEKISINYQYKL